jgi:hypothetical protein
VFEYPSSHHLDQENGCYARAYGPAINPDDYANYAILITFFEGLGVLVAKELIDISLVEDILSQSVIWYWDHIKPIAFEARRRLNDPTQYDHFEYLYHEMKHRQRSRAESYSTRLKPVRVPIIRNPMAEPSSMRKYRPYFIGSAFIS